MAKLQSFISGSQTFAGFVFSGNYDMPKDIFMRLYEYYEETGDNCLDVYSELIHLQWELNDCDYYDESGCLSVFDVHEYNHKMTLTSKARKLKLFSYDEIMDLRRYIKDCYKRWLIYEEKKRNQPRLDACKYVAQPEIQEYVFGKYGKKCLCCGSNDNISIDHIEPISKGGLNTRDNLQPLCKSCNSSKGVKVIDYR